MPGFQRVFSERYLSIEHLSFRTRFSGFTNISCEGVEMHADVRRRRAEGSVQQLELWWLLEDQSKRDDGIIVTSETAR